MDQQVVTKSQDIKYTSKTLQLYEPITLQNETDLKSILESAEPLYEYRTIVALKKSQRKQQSVLQVLLILHTLQCKNDQLFQVSFIFLQLRV